MVPLLLNPLPKIIKRICSNQTPFYIPYGDDGSEAGFVLPAPPTTPAIVTQ